MLINSIYETANVLLNKDQRGKISPFEFNSIIQQAQLKITNELLSEYKKIVFRKNRFNLGSGFADQTRFSIQAIEYYLTTKQASGVEDKHELEDDVWYLSEVYNSESLIEKTENAQFNTLKRSNRMKPSQCMPIFTMIGNTLYFYPIQENIEINYLRKPKDPKWTFEIVGNVPMFNSSANDFQDVDVHHSLISGVLIETLQMCGLNLREQDIEQYIAQMKQEAMAKQNAY